MKKLIIISGISGTGKSTLAKELYEKIERSTWISLDILAENIYDIMGFKNKEEKKSLTRLYCKIYKKLIEEALARNDEVVIVEYPYKKEWIKFFERIIEKYQYQVYTIHLYTKNFDELWKRLEKREKSKQRHPSHYLKEYQLKKKETYQPYFEYTYDHLKKEYIQGLSNCITLGKVIEIEDIRTLEIDQLIKMLKM